MLRSIVVVIRWSDKRGYRGRVAQIEKETETVSSRVNAGCEKTINLSKPFTLD